MVIPKTCVVHNSYNIVFLIFQSRKRSSFIHHNSRFTKTQNSRSSSHIPRTQPSKSIRATRAEINKRRALVTHVSCPLRDASRRRLLLHTKWIRALLHWHRYAPLLWHLLLLLLVRHLRVLLEFWTVLLHRLQRSSWSHRGHAVQRQDGRLIEAARLGGGHGVFWCVGPWLLLRWLLVLLRLLELLLLLLGHTGHLWHHRLLLLLRQLLLLPRVRGGRRHAVILLHLVLRRPLLLLLWLLRLLRRRKVVLLVLLVNRRR